MLVIMALAGLSAVVIGHDILPMRLFSIVLWRHFASRIIRLALPGFGASGTFIAPTRQCQSAPGMRGAVLFPGAVPRPVRLHPPLEAQHR